MKIPIFKNKYECDHICISLYEAPNKSRKTRQMESAHARRLENEIAAEYQGICAAEMVDLKKAIQSEYMGQISEAQIVSHISSSLMVLLLFFCSEKK